MSFIGLPYKPELASEALSSTHLFTVEILSVEATPWSAESDELEHRRLGMEVRLLEIFKGALDVRPHETFRVEVEQRRESAYVVSEYHGLWSHMEPAVGQHYLVVANGETTSPAALMQEGPCRGLLDAGYESDVRLELEAERLFQEALAETHEADPEFAAVRALIKFTSDRRSVTRDVVARYLWDYAEPVFLRAPERLLSDILSLITAENATLELRRSLISDLYDAVLDLEPIPEVSRKVIRAFFALLFQPSASRLHSSLIEVQLYNLIFHEEQPQFAVESIFPNPADRSRVKDALRDFDSDRAQDLMAWLDS